MALSQEKLDEIGDLKAEMMNLCRHIKKVLGENTFSDMAQISILEADRHLQAYLTLKAMDD